MTGTPPRGTRRVKDKVARAMTTLPHFNGRTGRLRRFATLFVLSAGCLLAAARSSEGLAAEPPLRLVIQPILSPENTREAFRPLADYLSRVTGRPCVIITMPNFLSYWEFVRKPASYELVLDAAHFTDYRIQKMGFRPLVKVPDTVSYSLVVLADNPVFDPIELTGRTIATLGPPSIGAARLNSLFPNPSRQPIVVEVESSEEALALLLKGHVQAAILPTPIVSQQMASGGGGLYVVTTTEPIPHIALSASPTLDPVLAERIRTALLNADKSDEGRAMLKAVNFPKFDPATPEIYAGQSNLLKQYWGY